MRGNAENRAVAFHSTYFNSRLYTRGDLLYSVCIYSLANFNSHLYIRGDTNKLPIAAEEEIFQFTPLHERQHRWHRGCNLYIYFNSRLYMRGNLMLQNLQCYHLIISIHASTWEATIYAIRTSVIFYFNSRLYMRGNLFEAAVHTSPGYFNSRLYMRGNERRWYRWKQKAYFNSRLYMTGNCFRKSASVFLTVISIHASTWEATVFMPPVTLDTTISILASAWEATQKEALISYSSLFQFSPLHERQPGPRLYARQGC